MSDSLGGIEFDRLDLVKHDKFGGSERKVVFIDLYIGVGESDALVFVKDLVCHRTSNLK